MDTSSPTAGGAEHYLPSDEDPTPHKPAHKNTKRWCKGKVGREHIPTIVPNPVIPENKRGRCTGTRMGWLGCQYEVHCATCGKTLVHFFSMHEEDQCPDMQADTQQHSLRDLITPPST